MKPTVVILQPGYIPWLGFFDQMRRADVFVYYDDVQYDKHGWRNRNRIKTQTGASWLTVPVRHSGLGWPRILEIEIDGRGAWARKHLTSLRQAYARAPFFSHYMAAVEEVLARPWARLVDLDVTLAGMMARMLDIDTEVVRASGLGIDGTQTERLVRICRHFGAARYLSGSAARTYLQVPLFEAAGIAVEWQDFAHPVYPQLHGAFVPYLSALDLLFNCGPDARRILAGASMPRRLAEREPNR